MPVAQQWSPCIGKALRTTPTAHQANIISAPPRLKTMVHIHPAVVGQPIFPVLKSLRQEDHCLWLRANLDYAVKLCPKKKKQKEGMMSTSQQGRDTHIIFTDVPLVKLLMYPPSPECKKQEVESVVRPPGTCPVMAGRVWVLNGSIESKQRHLAGSLAGASSHLEWEENDIFPPSNRSSQNSIATGRNLHQPQGKKRGGGLCQLSQLEVQMAKVASSIIGSNTQHECQVSLFLYCSNLCWAQALSCCWFSPHDMEDS